eukprot:351703-Chlamydomonas_euryale.AAC.1
MIYCEPTRDEVAAEQVAHLFYRAVFRHHGIPKSLVSDRDTGFTSSFWREMCNSLGTRLNMSTSNHPQTDGQTERANRTLEDMLRAFVSPHNDDWDELLVNAEFVYNALVNRTNGFTLFYLNYGRHPQTPLSLVTGQQAGKETVVKFVAHMRQAHEDARAAMRLAQETQAKYANMKRRDVEFQDRSWSPRPNLSGILASSSRGSRETDSRGLLQELFCKGVRSTKPGTLGEGSSLTGSREGPLDNKGGKARSLLPRNQSRAKSSKVINARLAAVDQLVGGDIAAVSGCAVERSDYMAEGIRPEPPRLAGDSQRSPEPVLQCAVEPLRHAIALR